MVLVGRAANIYTGIMLPVVDGPGSEWRSRRASDLRRLTTTLLDPVEDEESRMAQVFECPSCSGPLKPDGAAPTVTCPYCGDSVIVPPDLRTPLPHPPAAHTVVVQMPVHPPQPITNATDKSRGTGAGCGVLIVLFILLTVALPIYLDRD